MDSIVLQLQRDLMNKDVLLSDSLRKALVIARKLKLDDLSEWLGNELRGYYGGQEFPYYREVAGTVKGLNRYHGWQIVHFESDSQADIFSKRKVAQSIAELEHLLEDSVSSSILQYSLPSEFQNSLCSKFGGPDEVSLHVTCSAMAHILDTVKTLLLEWALKLEEDGVVGSELTFSDEEQNAAKLSQQVINNFYAPVGSAQIQVQSPGAVQVADGINLDVSSISEFNEKLKEIVGSLDLSEDSRKELNADIGTVESQLSSSKPKAGVIRESLSSIRRILEGAGGGAAGQLLVDFAKLFTS